MSLAPRIDRIEKNYLINGGMDFAQRDPYASGEAISTTPTYVSLDRWLVSYTGTVTGSVTSSRLGLAPTLATDYSGRVVLRRNGTAGTIRWEQRVEADSMRELMVALKASFSAQFYTAQSGITVRLTLNAPTAKDNYTSVTQVYQSAATALTASQWNLVKFEGLTLPSTIQYGLAVVWEFILPSATDGASVDYHIAEAMMNAGPAVGSFARHGRTYADELRACQRYYEKSYGLSIAPGAASQAGTAAMFFVMPGDATRLVVTANSNFQAYKRVAPVISLFSASSGSESVLSAYNGANSVNVTSYSSGSQNSLTNYVQLSGSATSGLFYQANWVANAEL